MFYEEVEELDPVILEMLVHVLFGGATKNNLERRFMIAYHNILWIMKHRYKLTHKEQLFIIYKMADYSDTMAYMKAYNCNYNSAAKNAYTILKKGRVFVALHEVLQVRIACLLEDSFHKPFATEYENQKPFFDKRVPVEEINAKLENGEEFSWNIYDGFEEQAKHESENKELEPCEYAELEKLREENRNLKEIIQGQSQVIFELQSTIEELES